MPDRVEALPLREKPRRVELRVQDPFLVVQRAGEIGAVGRENGAAAATEQTGAVELRLQREVVGIRGRPLERARRYDVRAALACDMHEGRLPRIAVVGGRGDVDLDAGLVQREARERHVVLPAHEAADAPEAGLDRVQPAAVALPPDQPLVVRGHELAVVERERAVGRVVEERVVDRARPLRLHLVHAGDEPDAELSRARGEPLLGG